MYVFRSSKMTDSLEISNECLIKDVEICFDKHLGTGSYGVVYVATYHGCKVAAKRLHSIFFEDVSPREYQGILQSWKNELKLMSSLRHPNIVQFYGVFNSDDTSSLLLTGNSYIITELLVKSLQARNLENPRLTVRNVIDIAMDIATGLCYLHNRPNPIMHRDLASKNILLSLSGQAKIADLGVAKFTEQVQQSHTRHPGTDYYMPLETMISDYNHSIDVYALGVIILEMAIGKNPTATQNLKKVGDRLEVVPEKERRKNDFSELQNSPNILLDNVIMLCLQEKETRASASDVTKKLDDLKKSEMYQSCGVCDIFSVEQHKLREENETLKAKIQTLKKDFSMLQEANESLKAQVQTLEQNLRKSEESCKESENKLARYESLVLKSNTDAIQRSSKGPKPHIQSQQTTQYVPPQKALPHRMVHSMVVPKQYPSFSNQPLSHPVYSNSSDQSRSSQSHDQPPRSLQNLRSTQSLDQSRSPQSHGQPPRLFNNSRSALSFDQLRSEQSLNQLKSPQSHDLPSRSFHNQTQNTSIFDQPRSLQRFDQPGSLQNFDQPGSLHSHDQLPSSPYHQLSEAYEDETRDLYDDNLSGVPFSSLPTKNSFSTDFMSLPARLSNIPTTQKATEYLTYQLSCMNRVMVQLKSANHNTSETLVTSYVETLKEQIIKTTDYVSKLLIDTKSDQHLQEALQKIHQTLSSARFDNIHVHPKYTQDLITAIRDFKDALNKQQ